MKRMIVLMALMASGLAACAQTALYKKYAHRNDLRVYCVEHYPLVGGDTVTVTFFEADNDSVRDVINHELMSIDTDRRKKNYKETDVSLNLTTAEIERVNEIMKKHKYVVTFESSPLPGDGGRYSVNCPSDRPVILVFHVYSDEQYANATRHILSTEFDTNK